MSGPAGHDSAPSPLWDLLTLPAAMDPDRRILTFGDRSMNLEQLRTEAERLGRLLDGRPVALLDVNSDLAIVLMFACLSRGVRFVPLNYRLRTRELEIVLQRARAGTLVYGARYLEVAEGAWDGSKVELSALLDRTGPSAAPAITGTGDIVLFTSGTTTTPKPVPIESQSLAAYVMETTPACPADTRAESLLMSMPLYHVAGLVSVLRAVFAGRRITILEQFEAGSWIKAVEAHGITQAFVVPTMLERILETDPGGLDEMRSLRTLTYGGGPMNEATIRRALDAFPPQVDFVGVYGLTEAGGTVCVLDEQDHARARTGDSAAVRRLSSVGRPLPGVSVQIQDESGTSCPAGSVGEIVIRSPHLSAAAASLDADGQGILRTGDLGEVDREGYVFFRGRADDMIVRGGENISPAEIETVLRQSPAIRECAVFGVPDRAWGERVVAAVVPAGRLDLDQLRSELGSALASYKWPAQFVTVEALPMTPTGKVLKRELKSLIATDAVESSTHSSSVLDTTRQPN